MEEIPVTQWEHPPWTVQWMRNIQTSIVFELTVYSGSTCHRSLCYLNTGSIFRQRWIETYSGNILGVDWNPKWWLGWIEVSHIKELRCLLLAANPSKSIVWQTVCRYNIFWRLPIWACDIQNWTLDIHMRIFLHHQSFILQRSKPLEMMSMPQVLHLPFH